MSFSDVDSLSTIAITVLLSHDPTLLSIQDLGNLSVCSKGTLKAMETTSTWKKVFEAAVALEEDAESIRAYGERVVWNDEDGFLPCFSNPDRRILQRVGYKNAAGCLLSKTCKTCKKFAGSANPFSMTRVCTNNDCKARTPHMITKCKARSCFLLNESDLRDLPSVVVPNAPIAGSRRGNTFYSYDDVVNMSFGKFGGPNGLAEEISRRAIKAMEKYEKKMFTANPLKKLPSICKQVTRPADHPARVISSHGSYLPAGILTVGLPTTDRWLSSINWYTKPWDLSYAHCTRCPKDECGYIGLDSDLRVHLLVDHNALKCHPTLSDVFVDDHLCNLPTDLPSLLSLQLPSELVFTLARIVTTKSHCVVEFRPMLNLDIDKKIYCVDFGDYGGCNVKIWIEEDKEASSMAGHCQIDGPIIHKTFFSSSREAFGGDHDNYFKDRIVLEILSKLGLTQTSPTQFMAGLFATMFGIQEILSTDVETRVAGRMLVGDRSIARYGASFGKVPILRDAFSYLQEKVGAGASAA